MVSKYYNAFNNLSQETKAGIVLIIATILALVCSNTILHDLYSQLMHLSFRVQIGQAYLDKPLILWINDGLMSIFFFIIGLELKREILEGHLKDLHSVMLPCAAAVGGIIVPVLFFSLTLSIIKAGQYQWQQILPLLLEFYLYLVKKYQLNLSYLF